MVEKLFVPGKTAEPLRALFLDTMEGLYNRTYTSAQAAARMRTGIMQILTTSGIVATPGSNLDFAIRNFCVEKVEEFSEIGRQRRIEWADSQAQDVRESTPVTGTHNRFTKAMGHGMRSAVFSILLFVVGMAISATVNNMYFVVGFTFWAFYNILPDPGETKLAETSGVAGSLFSGNDKVGRANRVNTGIAILKAITRIGIIVCFTLGLYQVDIPFSNFILLFMVFGFYFSLPVEFNPKMPYEFMLSACRFLLAIWIGFSVFGGIFQSSELQWLTVAFFAVWPVATEQKSLARAIGFLGAGSGQNYAIIDKFIFLFIMVLFLITNTGSSNLVTLFSSGTAGVVFSAVWVLGLVSGLTTPAETRPWMGIIILIVGFVIFGLGAGQQTMGVAFFGEWWPSIHNGVTEFMTPLGDMFGQFQGTFGQTFLLLTNPSDYAKQITQGTYSKNDLGSAGAFGLEITRFDVQSIYIGEPFVIQIDLTNKGIYHAKNITIELLTNIKDFSIGTDSSNMNKMISAYEDGNNKQWYNYIINKTTPTYGEKLIDVEMQDAVSLFLVGTISCDDIKASNWQDDVGFIKDKEHDVREMFIPFVLNISYDYEAESSFQMDFISDEEWKRLSELNILNRGPRISTISSSPASLNIGGMDQPIKYDSPFYVGFNLSTTWPQKTLITNARVNFHMPKDFVPFNNADICTGTYDSCSIVADTRTCKYDFTGVSSKSSFCNYKGTGNIVSVPTKTYTITADATYRFSKWQQKDTLFSFNTGICDV